MYTYIYIYIYMCMYVCLYVCMYVCMYVSYTIHVGVQSFLEVPQIIKVMVSKFAFESHGDLGILHENPALGGE